MPLCVLRVHFDSPGSDTAVRFGHLVYKTVPGNYFVHIFKVKTGTAVQWLWSQDQSRLTGNANKNKSDEAPCRVLGTGLKHVFGSYPPHRTHLARR